MKGRQERQPETLRREPRVTSLVVSVLLHAAAVFAVVGGAWLWGTPALDTLATYRVSLIDAPLSLRQPSSDMTRPAPTATPPPIPVPDVSVPKPVPAPPKAPEAAAAQPAPAPKEVPKTTSAPPLPQKVPEAKKTPQATSAPPLPQKAPEAKKAPPVPKPEPKKAAVSPTPPKPSAAKKPRPVPPKRGAKASSATSTEAQAAIHKLRKRQAQRELAGRRDTSAQQQARVAAARIAALRQQVDPDVTSGAAAGLSRVRLAAYQERVRAKIIEAWILPLPPQQTRELQATAFFQVTRDGHVEHLDLVQPSGNALFDASLLRAIKRASPLPDLPLDYPSNLLEVEMRFRARES